MRQQCLLFVAEHQGATGKAMTIIKDVLNHETK
jgi:hypothetical protein